MPLAKKEVLCPHCNRKYNAYYLEELKQPVVSCDYCGYMLIGDEVQLNLTENETLLYTDDSITKET